MQQQTLAAEARCRGVGLHSGTPVAVTFRPAPPGTGVVFVRSDLEPPVAIPARPASLHATRLATTLAAEGVTLAAVEHALAALAGLGVDNARVDVDGPELPGLDGSAAPFVALLRRAGVVAQSAPRPRLRLRAPLCLVDGDRRIEALPDERLRISYAIDFDHAAIGRQELHLPRLDAEGFRSELAPARTFGFLAEVEALRRAGFARGASEENTVVVGTAGVVNADGLRFPDEFVRHKVLDLVGDLALLGAPLVGHVRVERGGHGLHAALVAALHADPALWELEPAAPARHAVGA